jgi:hypothetical protein
MGGSFSVCGWFKLHTLTGLHYFVSKWYGSEQEWLVRADPAPDVGFYISSNGVNATAVTYNESPVVETWYFFAAVYDSAASQIRVSVNDSTPAITAFSGPVFHGSQALGVLTGAGALSNCAVDELGIWNRALTAAEITTLYNSGAGRTYPFP